MILGTISRCFINNSLTKKSDGLKARCETFEAELKTEVNAVIEETNAKNTANLNELMYKLNAQLQDDREFMNAVTNPLTQYIWLTFSAELLYKKQELLYAQWQRISSQIDFLNDEMQLENEQLEELSASRRQIMSYSDTRAYKDLLLYSGAVNEDGHIYEQLEEQADDTKNDAEKRAIRRTMGILKDAHSLQKDLSLLDWAIEQHKAYIGTLCAARGLAIRVIKGIQAKQADIGRQSEELNNQRLPYAQEIRRLVGVNSSYVNEQVETLKMERTEFYDAINEIKDINSKLGFFYDNPDSWDEYQVSSLKSMRNSISAKINSMRKPDEIKAEIRELFKAENERKHHRMQIVSDVLKQYGVFLIGSDQYDS